MKKLVFAFAAIVAVSFASCGNKTAEAEAVDSDTVVTVDSCCDSVCCDSAAVDSTVAE